MAESTSLATGVGKIQTKEQRARMAKLMNFLPILGESNQQMAPLKVDSLLSKLKRAYAEKAVRTGFDDDSIYSDQLLMIKDPDLQAFNHLKGIIGTTKKDKKPMKVDVNHQGLDEEEYDKAEKARKKKEEVNVNNYETFEEAKLAIFEFIESWYNNQRIHSSLDYITPNEKYNNYIASLAAA